MQMMHNGLPAKEPPLPQIQHPASILASRMASFPLPYGPRSAPAPHLAQTCPSESRLETKSENEARSALLARLWCHLILENPANRAENPTRLCSATIGQTGWRMVQVGAIRSWQKVVQLLAEILKQKIQWRFRRFRVYAFREFRNAYAQVLREGCFTRSRVSTLVPISFYPILLQ